MSGIVFWIATAALAAGLGALVWAFAARAARGVEPGADPALAVHRRQLAELDELVTRGVMGEAEKKAAYAEAGRRLLVAEAKPETAVDAKGGKLVALGVIVAAALLALTMYLKLGSPGTPDQPYVSRLAAWKDIDPAKLSAPELAALMRQIVKDRPYDAQAYTFLGRLELESGNVMAATQALQKAVALSPKAGEIYTLLGQALIAGQEEKMPREAVAVFAKAVSLDPTDVPARFYLAQADIQAGQREQGVAKLNALAGTLPDGDPRKARIEEEARVAAGAAVVAAAAPPEQAAFIQAMVARLAERLKQEPNDPPSWARLVRAYGVLGDTKAQADALAQARKLFAGRVNDLAVVEAEAPK